jgi:hypothetical protein
MTIPAASVYSSRNAKASISGELDRSFGGGVKMLVQATSRDGSSRRELGNSRKGVEAVDSRKLRAEAAAR